MTTAAICPTWGVLRGASYYRAEQYDSDLGLYYLRARYYNPLTGRFMSRDPEDGKAVDPKTLHKYLYAGGDPVDAIDPRGRDIIEYDLGILAEYNPVEVGEVAVTRFVVKTLVCTSLAVLTATLTKGGAVGAFAGGGVGALCAFFFTSLGW